MVSTTAPADAGRTTCHRGSAENINVATSARNIAPADRENDSLGMQTLRGTYVNHGFSPQVTEVMMRAKRMSTNRQYNTYITQWLNYCNAHNISPSTASIP